MSFVYLPAEAADCSPPSTYSGSEPSATSRSTATASVSCKPASTTGCSTTPRSGMTLEHSTGDPGVDAWILSLRDSRANPSPVLASDEAKPTSEISGPTPFASLKRCGQRGFFWKTHPTCDALDGKRITTRRRKPVTSGRYLATWPAAGSMRNGACYLREPLERTTAGGGSGLLPTPVASECSRGHGTKYSQGGQSLTFALRQLPTPIAADAKRGGNTKFGTGGPSLTLALRMLPTPTVKGNYNRASYSSKAGNGLVTALKMLPTPLARDYRSGKGKKTRHGKHSPCLPETLVAEDGGESGLLNPDFAEWMLGWPTGWTGLEPLDEAKFRWWLRQHGRS